jgi:hypothetical protein
VDNFVHEYPLWLPKAHCHRDLLIVAQKTYRDKINIKQIDTVSCNMFATSTPLEAANLLGLWIEMKLSICHLA